MATVSLQEAQAGLADLIRRLTPGEEVVITEDGRPVARLLLAGNGSPKVARRLGTLRGTVLHMAPDFDAPLDEFKDYME